MTLHQYLVSLGIEPKTISLYTLAFTHKSYGNERKTENNERLEFLGDAVLELLVTEFLYKHYRSAPEGKMTALRSAIVRKDSLASLAKTISLGEHIRLSRGERHGYKKDYILANTVEALLGALYLDRGMRACKLFLEQYLFPEIVAIEQAQNYIGPKSRFQEWAQAEKLMTPYYELLSSRGPDHAKIFTMGAFLGETQVATGEGNSKQNAESAAAERALEYFGVVDDPM